MKGGIKVKLKGEEKVEKGKQKASELKLEPGETKKM